VVIGEMPLFVVVLLKYDRLFGLEANSMKKPIEIVYDLLIETI
jgi:hypothetical protein